MDEKPSLGELLLRFREADAEEGEEIRRQIKELVLAGPRFQRLIDEHATRPSATEPQLGVDDQPSEALYRRMLAGDDFAKQEFFRRCRDQLRRDAEALEDGRLDVNDPGPDPVIASFLRKSAEVVHRQ